MRSLVKYCCALAATLALGIVLSASQKAAAATFIVNSTGDTSDIATGDGTCADPAGVCTLRAAIQEANSFAGSDTINLSVTGTINLTGALPDIISSMTINGPGASLLTVRRDTGGDYRIFFINNQTVNISGLTVANGKTADGAAGGTNGGSVGSGAGISASGVLMLTDVVITGNATGNGGPATDGTNSFGGSGGSGGGVFSAGVLMMTKCVVSNNRTGSGGTGGYAGSGGRGGGIYAFGTITLANVTITGNQTGDGGVGINGGLSGGNSGYGGGLYIEGTLNMTNVNISNNSTGNVVRGSAGGGGGIFIYSGTVNLTNSTVGNNHTGSGSGYVSQGGYGGGIANFGTLTVTGSAITGNTTGDSDPAGGGNGGGGIFNNFILTLTNSTISGNSTGAGGGTGGGISSGTTLTLINCTITGNAASNNNGNGAYGGNTTSIRNTIIAGNGGSSGADVLGNFTSQGHNLVGNANGSTGFNAAGDQVGTSTVPLDPRLGPLADNGGPTRTHALLAGSPALDAGDNALARDANSIPFTTDQRGAGRFATASVGGGATPIVDIGAFEFHPSLEAISDKTTNEDMPFSFLFNIGDASGNSSSVIASADNQLLVPDANLTVTGSGPIRTLQIIPAANQSGTGHITLTVTDSSGGVTSASFLLTVIAVNDAPGFTKGANQTIVEDSGPQTITGWATNLSAGPADESGQSLAFLVTGNTNPGLFSTAPALSPTGALTYTPAADAFGSAVITVVLKDNGGTLNGGQDTSAAQTFTITITGINDPPVNTVPGPQSVPANTLLVFAAHNGNLISIADADAQNNPIAVTLTATNGTLTLGSIGGLTFTVGNGFSNPTMSFTGNLSSISAAFNNGLTFNPTHGFTGAAVLTIVTNDQGNTGAGGALSATSTVNITINNGGTLQFSSAAYSVNESAGNASVTITRTGGSAGATTVNYLVSAGTAKVFSDYTPVSGALTFAAGETSKTFLVPIIDDALNEDNETINLLLSNVTGSGTLGAPGTAVLTIVDNDLLPNLTINNIAVPEGNSGVANASFTVNLSASSGRVVSVAFATADGTATAGSDYQSASGTLTFNAGETVKTITVPINGDTLVEPDETFLLTLSGPSNAAVVGAQGTGTIVNDDSRTIQFAAPGYQAGEGDGRATITITRTGDLAGPATVDFGTVDDPAAVRCDDTVNNHGAAYARCDYATVVSAITFAVNEASKTISIPVIDDAHVEGVETLQVRLSNPVGATLGTSNVATVSIQDNDTGPAANPIFNSQFFVRQHYLDFLSREPDAGGFNAWLGVLNNCSDVNNNPNCDRLLVSQSFFGSPEFQLKGFYVFRFYRLVGNRLPAYDEIIPDMSSVTGQTGDEVYQKKAAFANIFTRRQEFVTNYGGLTNANYVSALLNRYGLTQITTPDPANPDGATKITLTGDELTSRLAAGTLTRAQVLRGIADSDQVNAAEFNSAFVAMQYYGYLRRTPEPGGYQSWLTYLTTHPTDFRTMVNGFMNSTEYRLRFGQ